MKKRKKKIIPTSKHDTLRLTGQIPPMFFVTSAHPLQGTRLVAVWVVRYTVVTGLRLQGINVFSVVVQVGEGTCLALLYLRSVETIWIRGEEH